MQNDNIYDELITVTEKSLNAMKTLKANPDAQLMLVNFFTELGKKILTKTNDRLIDEFSKKAQNLIDNKNIYFSNEARESLANFFDLLKSTNQKNEAAK